MLTNNYIFDSEGNCHKCLLRNVHTLKIPGCFKGLL